MLLASNSNFCEIVLHYVESFFYIYETIGL